MLRGAETRMSEKVLTTMYRAMRTNDESTDGYYILQKILVHTHERCNSET